jgi:hypothetical protein
MWQELTVPQETCRWQTTMKETFPGQESSITFGVSFAQFLCQFVNKCQIVVNLQSRDHSEFMQWSTFKCTRVSRMESKTCLPVNSVQIGSVEFYRFQRSPSCTQGFSTAPVSRERKSFSCTRRLSLLFIGSEILFTKCLLESPKDGDTPGRLSCHTGRTWPINVIQQ